MPKMKTRKSVAKRFKKTGSGQLKRAHMGGSHILTGKTRKHKRRLRGSELVNKADIKRLIKFIPYS
jgi:large subunit ribosomal protein L35